MTEMTFRALGTDVALHLDDDPVFAPPIRAIIAGYSPAEGPATVQYRIRAGDPATVTRDDTVLHRAADARDVAPVFELDLYRQLSVRAKPGWLLHAAAVRTDEGAIVIAGPSGAGKTTLCLALLARGHSYMTEEMVLIDPDRIASGLARPLHLEVDDPRLAWAAAGLARVPYEMRDWTGASQNHVLLAPDPAMTHVGTAPLRLLIRVRHEPGKAGGLYRLPPAAALMALWGCTLRQDSDGLELATALIRERPVYELRASTVPDALRYLGGLLQV